MIIRGQSKIQNRRSPIGARVLEAVFHLLFNFFGKHFFHNFFHQNTANMLVFNFLAVFIKEIKNTVIRYIEISTNNLSKVSDVWLTTDSESVQFHFEAEWFRINIFREEFDI